MSTPNQPPRVEPPAPDPWGATFRELWSAARPAGRRRAAFLAVGLPRATTVAAPGLRRPLRAPPTPEEWAAGVRADGTRVPAQ